jgi:hypothetical protein
VVDEIGKIAREVKVASALYQIALGVRVARIGLQAGVAIAVRGNLLETRHVKAGEAR